MEMKNKILSIFCAVCILFTGFGEVLTFAGTQSYTLTASDGNAYRITVTYNDASGIPEGAVLTVREITEENTQTNGAENEPTYQDYVDISTKLIGEESAPLARVFDITLVDPATGDVYQPDNEVKVTIELLDDSIENYYKVEVVHIHDLNDEAELMNATVNGESVEFKTDGFSVYVIISHEGGEDVETPRVEFHYINYEFAEVTSRPYFYEAAPFQFINKNNENQISQIVTNGETLEMIANPPNKKDDNGKETSFFYGWYTVDVDRENDDTTVWDEANGTWTGTIIYTWPAPQKVEVETPVTIEGSGGATTFKTGDDIVWTVGESSGTAKLDENGTAHVYLVPMYSDFYFVNFRMGNKESDSSLRNNLLTRRLIVFGTSTEATIRIGDVECPSPDPAHQIFAGWETVKNESGSLVTEAFYATLDLNGDEIDGTYNADGSENTTNPSTKPGFYITIEKSNDEEKKSVDLYPVFAEARWINYNIGSSGNGAIYVPSVYRLTNDDNKGTSINKFPVTTRPGFDFAGWYVNAAMVDSDIMNLAGDYDIVSSTTTHYTQAIQLTDEEGNILSTLNGKKYWKEDPSTESIKYGDALPDGKEKLFEIDNKGNLWFYKPLDELILSAKWDPKVVEYTVVYWLQNANDDNYTLVTYESFEAIAGDNVKISSSGDNGRTLTIDASNGTDHDHTVTMQSTNENADYYIKDLRFIHYKTYDGMDGNTNKGVYIKGDGSTVINAYYDRNVYRLRFDIGFARRTSTSGSTLLWSELSQSDALNYSETVYGIVDGLKVELTSDGNGGWTYEGSIDVRNQYDGYRYKVITTGDGQQYGIVNNTVVELNGSITYKRSENYYYSVSNSTTSNNYYIPNDNGVLTQTYLYRNNNKWYKTRSGWTNYTYSDEYTGIVYSRNNQNNVSGQTYNGTLFYFDSNGNVSTSGNSTPYGSLTNGQYFLLNANPNYTYGNGTSYGNGTRYLRIENTNEDESYTLGFIDGQMKPILLDANGWYYNTQSPVTLPYSGKLYGQSSVSGTWEFSVSNTTNPNNSATDSWDTFLTQHRYDLGTTNPFDLTEYTGYYNTTSGNTPYMVFYYDLVAKYGEYIMDKYPGSQPARKNGSYVFVGWLPQRDSYYTARLCTSIKGFFETMTDDLILTGGTIPNYQSKNANLSSEGYRAVTINENNTITGEYGITQEFRCRYRGTNGYNYLYRIYLADNETMAYPSEPTMKFIITAGDGSNPNLQTPPTFYGYHNADAKVLDRNGNGSTPGGTYSAYAIPELTAAGISGGMIMEFRLQPNQWQIDYKYGKGSSSNLIGETFGPSNTKYFGQSLASSDLYTDIAIANTPEGHTFAGWYETSDGIGNRFNFNSTMPDGNIILYAIYKPIEFLIKINPNGAEIDHIDHTGVAYSSGVTPLNRGEITYEDEHGVSIVERTTDSGYDMYRSNYFFADYNETVGEYAVSRSYVPISETAAAPYIAAGRSVYAYLNIQYRGGQIDGEWGVMYDLRDALYVDATHGTGQYKDNEPSHGETELYTFYKFYHDLINYEYAASPGWWDCDGAKELSFEAWKSMFVEKNDDNQIQLYRKCNSKENWVFLGWYKEGDSMPYNFSSPVKESFTLTAHWRLDGGYTIQYTPEFYLENGDLINGSMDTWTDPQQGSNMTYTDGAKTTVYKQPTNLTRNGAPVTDNSLIFRGWRIVSLRHTYSTDGTTILATEYIPLEDGVFYDPNDDYIVNVEFADSNNIIHMQAVYESSVSSYRRPSVTNLRLDANSGYLTPGSTADSSTTEELQSDIELPTWDHVGTVNLNAANDQITFENIQNSAKVHLYHYATTLAEDAANPPHSLTDAKNYFAHSGKYFLIGFDEDMDRSDYLATYPADGIIAVTRNDDQTIYAIWEPMVYLTFVNSTEGTVSFGLASDDNSALEVINVKEGMYGRRPLSDYSNIEIPAGETLQLAFPKGAEKNIVISGTNTLGVGKALVWNSSVKLDEGGSYGTTTGGEPVQYPHVTTNETHNHTLPTGKAKNTFGFTFTETLISNSEPVTVTFTTQHYMYSMVLRDNWNGNGTGGGMQEFDYSEEEITPDTNGPKSQELPHTSTRMAYEFLGWAYEPTATTPDFSAELPTGSPWTVPDLNKDDGFFQLNKTHLDGETYVRELYAVWRYKEEASHVYVYKNVPDPGDQTKKFTFSLKLYGKYTYNSNGDTETLNVTKVFSLAHGESAELISSNNTQQGYIQTIIKIYGTDGAKISETTVKAQANHPNASYGSFKNTEHITLTETTDEMYNTTIDRLSQVSNSNPLIIADSDDSTTNPLTGVSGNTVEWTQTDAGGTVIFNNIRKTKNITIVKEYVGNSRTAVIFSFTASYTVDGKTVNKGNFTVTSGTPNTEALEKIPLGAILTVTEATDNNYKQYRKIGSGAEEESTTAVFEVTADTTVYFKNVLKSYPVKFIKVDQDDAPGNDTGGRVEAFFDLNGPTYSLGGGTLYSNSSNHGVFYVSGGTNEPFYAGQTYTLRETWVQTGFERLTEPVTITVGSDAGNPFAISNPKVTVSYNNTDDVWEFRVKNQEVKDVKIIKRLSDPLVTQRTFTFNYSYTFNGETVSDTFTLPTVSGSQATKTLTIPVGATGLSVSENTELKTNETDTIAQTYTTAISYNGNVVTLDNKNDTVRTQIIGDITSSSDNEEVIFSNTRKTVNVTMKKIVKAEDTSGSFVIQLTIRQGEIPIKNYTVYKDDPNNPDDVDLVTGDDGVVAPGVSLSHNGEQTIRIPVGASVLVKEILTDDQYAAFMTMPGVDLKLKNGKADEVELIGPTEDKELRIYNIPCICKVTDDTSLLWFRVEGDETPNDTSDDIYIPAIYDTIKGAFDDLGKFYGKSGSTYTLYTDKTRHYQIKMLVDYEVPNTDVVEVPAGYNITFTTAERTATDGYPFRSARPYTGSSTVSVEDDDYRAVLTRADGSDKAFFTISKFTATDNTIFEMSDLIIDGDGENAQLGSTVRGGCVTAIKSDVTIDHCIIYNFQASVGSAVFTTGNSLTVKDSVFDTCISKLPLDGRGGGAINTTANELKIKDSSFSNCSAIHQGGAVYHYGASFNNQGTVNMSSTTGATKTAELENCVFNNCVSRAGGGIEADVGTVSLVNCDFINCKAQNMTYKDAENKDITTNASNGGGVNTYTEKFKAATTNTILTLTGCRFYGCTCSANGSTTIKGGGGLHSTHLTNTLTNCTFGYDSTDPTNTDKGCKAANASGGAAAFSAANNTATLTDCDIRNCSAKNGGGIYAEGTLTVQGTTLIKACTSSQYGGGINTIGNTTIKDATAIESCVATKSGGAIYVTGETAQVTISGDPMLYANQAKDLGGGAIFVTGNAAVIVNGGTISSNFIKAVSRQNVCGGAIYINGGTGTINGGTISENYTQTDSTGLETVGGAIFATGQSTLNITGGTISGNHSNTTTNGSYGGAIGLDGSNVNATISGGTISGNYAVSELKDAFGGAIAIRHGALLTISGGTISANYAQAKKKYYQNKDRYANGGAIAVVESSALSLSGGLIEKNYAENLATDGPTYVRGAGIYLEEGVTLNLSGSPSFGNGNMLKTELSGAKNGGEDYTYPRQDIYIPAINGVAPCIVVTGNIGSSAGSIWVYAPVDSTEAKQHYKEGQQFAIIKDGASVSDTSLLAFHDAQDDITSSGHVRSEYLTGIKGSNPSHVIWGIPVEGSRKVILRKVVKDTYVPLENAVFTIYKVKDVTVMNLNGVSLENLSSTNSGVFFIGELPYGTYWIKETSVPNDYKANSIDSNGHSVNWFELKVEPDRVEKVLIAESQSTTP